jgi:hypothetical protein
MATVPRQDTEDKSVYRWGISSDFLVRASPWTTLIWIATRVQPGTAKTRHQSQSVPPFFKSDTEGGLSTRDITCQFCSTLKKPKSRDAIETIRTLALKRHRIRLRPIEKRYRRWT